MSPIEADDAGEADGVALPATAGDVAEGDEGGQEEAAAEVEAEMGGDVTAQNADPTKEDPVGGIKGASN